MEPRTPFKEMPFVTAGELPPLLNVRYCVVPKVRGLCPKNRRPGFEERPGYPTRVAPDRGWHLV